MSKGKSATARPPVPHGSGGTTSEPPLARRVAENLRRLRKDRALSLDQLAAASGVSRAALSQIEGSKTNPTLAVLWKIAVGLGVPVQALLGVEDVGRARVLRASDPVVLRSSDGRMESRLVSPAGATPGLEVYELARRAARCAARRTAGTTETVVLLTGTLRVSVAEESRDLAPATPCSSAPTCPTSTRTAPRARRCLDIISYGRGG